MEYWSNGVMGRCEVVKESRTATLQHSNTPTLLLHQRLVHYCGHSGIHRFCRAASGGLLGLFLCCILFPVGVLAEDFDWSWEEDKTQQTGSTEKEQDPGQEFNWEWSEGETEKTEVPASSRTRPSGRTAAQSQREDTAPAVDPSAYNDLMRENIELRKRIAEKERAADKAAKRAETLAREQKTLQAQLNTLASTMDSLESQRAAAEDGSARVKELESKLVEAESEKKRLSGKLSELADTVQQLEEESAARAREQTIAEPEPETVSPGPTAAVQPGSDLFRELQEENTILKQKLAEIEDSRAKAARLEEEAEQVVDQSRERESDLQQELKAAKETQEQQKEVISGLLRRIPDMEKELKRLRVRAGGEESVLAARERELENIREEVRRREYRLIKAERMAAMMSEAREEVQEVTAEQTRNMHYNMAVVYAKEGRFREAETEYLRALRIDPADAATHYNIAILYDDELNSGKRAVMHYRKYLQLSPDAPDRDQVKQWIMRLEMQ